MRLLLAFTMATFSTAALADSFEQISFGDNPSPKVVSQSGLEVTVQSIRGDEHTEKAIAAIRYAGFQPMLLELESTPNGYSRGIGIGKLSVGDAAPSVIFQSFSGGAHCCSTIVAAVPVGGRLPKLQRNRLRRHRNPNPLILGGHGISLRINKGTLAIKEGFTHYPQKQIEHRYFKGDLELPRIIILLDGSGSLSFDVLNWLSEQGTSLVRIKYDGSIAIVAGAGFRVNPEKLKWQFELQSNEVKRIEFARELIAQKLLNCAETLKAQFDASERRERAIAKNEQGAAQLMSGHFSNMGDIRAIEGEAAAVYFSIWSDITMQWKSQSKYPVPKSWQKYLSRSSPLTGKRPKNKNAAHPVNAMLNYAYAAKASQLQIKAIADGYDPYFGIMHHSRDDFPAYVYDIIEPERPKVDSVILAFAQHRKFSGSDFILQNDGICRLSPQLARAIAMLV